MIRVKVVLTQIAVIVPDDAVFGARRIRRIDPFTVIVIAVRGIGGYDRAHGHVTVERYVDLRIGAEDVIFIVKPFGKRFTFRYLSLKMKNFVLLIQTVCESVIKNGVLKFDVVMRIGRKIARLVIELDLCACRVIQKSVGYVYIDLALRRRKRHVAQEKDRAVFYGFTVVRDAVDLRVRAAIDPVDKILGGYAV